MYEVTSTDDSGPNTLRQAITDANTLPAGSEFQIVIKVEGTLTALTPRPTLNLFAKRGLIHGNSNAVIVGFSCEMKDGAVLTLRDVVIDNGAHNAPAIKLANGAGKNTLLLSGNNRIRGREGDFPIVQIVPELEIDKAPGGSDLDSVLTLTNANIPVRGGGLLAVKGGTVESRGTTSGMETSPWVTGGKVIATGSVDGIFSFVPARPFRVEGGTVVAHGGGYDIYSFYEFIIIDGGSVNARRVTPLPVRDGSGNAVYLVTVTVGAPPVANTEVACSVNGGAEFTCITDDEGKLYLWMPAGDGAAEIDVGGMIYRASGTVENNLDNVMLAQPVPPVVTGVVVTPSSVTAVRGSTVQFSASVEGEHNPPQTVTWTVENAHAGTAIDGSGLLTISADESSQTLLVTATSTYDTSQSGTAQVAVAAGPNNAIGMIFFFIILALLLVFFAMMGMR